MSAHAHISLSVFIDHVSEVGHRVHRAHLYSINTGSAVKVSGPAITGFAAVTQFDAVVHSGVIVVVVTSCNDPTCSLGIFCGRKHSRIEGLAANCLMVVTRDLIVVDERHKLGDRSMHKDEVSSRVFVAELVLLAPQPLYSVNGHAAATLKHLVASRIGCRVKDVDRKNFVASAAAHRSYRDPGGKKSDLFLLILVFDIPFKSGEGLLLVVHLVYLHLFSPVESRHWASSRPSVGDIFLLEEIHGLVVVMKPLLGVGDLGRHDVSGDDYKLGLLVIKEVLNKGLRFQVVGSGTVHVEI